MSPDEVRHADYENLKGLIAAFIDKYGVRRLLLLVSDVLPSQGSR